MKLVKFKKKMNEIDFFKFGYKQNQLKAMQPSSKYQRESDAHERVRSQNENYTVVNV